MRVTRPNLLSWYDAGLDPTALPTFSQDCRTGALVTFPGDITRFFLNPLTPSNDTAFIPAVKLVAFRDNGAVTSAVQDIKAEPVGKTTYGSITCPNVPYGFYRYRLDYPSYQWFSTLFEVMSPTDARACSIKLEYRNSRSVQGMRWPWVDDSFTASQRVRCNLIDAPMPVSRETYREATTGILRPYNTAMDEILTFRTTYVDRVILEGLAVALIHDNLTLNGRSVTLQDALTTQPSTKMNLWTGQFSVVDNSFANPLIP